MAAWWSSSPPAWCSSSSLPPVQSPWFSSSPSIPIPLSSPARVSGPSGSYSLTEFAPAISSPFLAVSSLGGSNAGVSLPYLSPATVPQSFHSSPWGVEKRYEQLPCGSVWSSSTPSVAPSGFASSPATNQFLVPHDSTPLDQFLASGVPPWSPTTFHPLPVETIPSASPPTPAFPPSISSYSYSCPTVRQNAPMTPHGSISQISSPSATMLVHVPHGQPAVMPQQLCTPVSKVQPHDQVPLFETKIFTITELNERSYVHRLCLWCDENDVHGHACSHKLWLHIEVYDDNLEKLLFTMDNGSDATVSKVREVSVRSNVSILHLLKAEIEAAALDFRLSLSSSLELEGTEKAMEQALKKVDKDEGEFEEEEESEEEDADGQEEVEDDDELHWAMRDEDVWDKWQKKQKGKRMFFGRSVKKKQKQQRMFLVPKKQREESKMKKKKHLSSLRIAANVDEDEFEKWQREVKGAEAEAERAKNGSSFGNTDDGFHWDVDEFDDNVAKSVEFECFHWDVDEFDDNVVNSVEFESVEFDLEEMRGVNHVVNCVVHVEDVKESLDDVILERFPVLIDVAPWEQSGSVTVDAASIGNVIVLASFRFSGANVEERCVIQRQEGFVEEIIETQVCDDPLEGMNLGRSRPRKFVLRAFQLKATQKKKRLIFWKKVRKKWRLGVANEFVQLRKLWEENVSLGVVHQGVECRGKMGYKGQGLVQGITDFTIFDPGGLLRMQSILVLVKYIGLTSLVRFVVLQRSEGKITPTAALALICSRCPIIDINGATFERYKTKAKEAQRLEDAIEWFQHGNFFLFATTKDTEIHFIFAVRKQLFSLRNSKLDNVTISNVFVLPMVEELQNCIFDPGGDKAIGYGVV